MRFAIIAASASPGNEARSDDLARAQSEAVRDLEEVQDEERDEALEHDDLVGRGPLGLAEVDHGEHAVAAEEKDTGIHPPPPSRPICPGISAAGARCEGAVAAEELPGRIGGHDGICREVSGEGEVDLLGLVVGGAGEGEHLVNGMLEEGAGRISSDSACCSRAWRWS